MFTGKHSTPNRSFLWILRNFSKQLFYRTPPVAAFDFWKHYEGALINVFVVLQSIEKNFVLVFFTTGSGTNRFLFAVNTFKTCLENVGCFIMSSLFPAARTRSNSNKSVNRQSWNLFKGNNTHTIFTLPDLVLLVFCVNIGHT